MQVPITKPCPYGNPEHDSHITLGHLNNLKDELKKLKSKLNYAQSEVARLAQLGDFSENVEYSIAKGKLRGLNRRILELESQILLAQIINPTKNSKAIEIGHKIEIKIKNIDEILKRVQDDNDKIQDSAKKTYTILGPAEASPSQNIISYISPLGSALIGKKLGEKFKVKIGTQEKEIEILNIN